MLRMSVGRRLLHLVHTAAVMPAFTVTPLPLFSDNYAYLVTNAVHKLSFIVDPADAPAVLAALPSSGVAELTHVLTTHHHPDHSGGNVEMAAARPGIAVVGGAEEGGRIPAATLLVKDGQTFEAAGLTITALHTPCHTVGHICYVVTGDPDRPPAVFTGDTLFAGGCGRFFEGDAPTMAASFAKLVAACPPATQVFCGHEYTLANLRFCAHVEPGNAATKARFAAATALREADRPTVPSTMADELATNVFLRCAEPAVVAFTHPGADAARVDPVEVLARLREAKNAFTG